MSRNRTALWIAAAFLLGVIITLIGQTQLDQMEQRSMDVYCDLHLFDEQCLNR